MGIDNWVDVASIIVQKTIGITDVPTCDSLAMGFGPMNYSTTLFGNNQPAVVGLTEGLYAGVILHFSCTFLHCFVVTFLPQPQSLME